MVLESEERRLVLGRDQPDVAAVAAVAAVGPAPVDVRLAPPRHRAGPAVARARVQLGLIHEAGHGEKDYEPSNRRARLGDLRPGAVLVDVRAAPRLDHA